MATYTPDVPKFYFAQRLPKSTIDQIKRQAKAWGIGPAQALVRIVARGTGGNPILDVGGRPMATKSVRRPILKPSAKSL